MNYKYVGDVNKHYSKLAFYDIDGDKKTFNSALTALRSAIVRIRSKYVNSDAPFKYLLILDINKQEIDAINLNMRVLY